MEGRLQPFLPELTIRDYNTYLWYLRGVRRQMYLSYGLYSCRYLRHNGVLYALLADSLAGRTATCKRARLPGTLCWKTVMCQTQGIRLAAQVEVMMAWHRFQDRKWTELELGQRLRRGLDRLLLRRAYDLEEKLKNRMASQIVTDRNRAVEAESRLRQLIEKQAVRDRHRLELMSSRLDGLSPLKKIGGGSGFLTNDKNRRIESVEQVKKGDLIQMRIRDGRIDAVVSGTAAAELGAR